MMIQDIVVIVVSGVTLPVTMVYLSMHLLELLDGELQVCLRIRFPCPSMELDQILSYQLLQYVFGYVPCCTFFDRIGLHASAV